MKRSEINECIEWAINKCQEHNFYLPAFAYWSEEDWKKRSIHMRDAALGWDVTDYSSGDFYMIGAVLFTLRNGNRDNNAIGTPYCEKIIVLRENQALPMHFHFSKTEDIINRSGGILCLRLYNSIEKNGIYDIDVNSDVFIRMDGEEKTLRAGSVVEVTNGNSISLPPYLYHEFWAKEDTGDLIIGEVSSINDDTIDNQFLLEITPQSIEEDDTIRYPLCSDE